MGNSCCLFIKKKATHQKPDKKKYEAIRARYQRTVSEDKDGRRVITERHDTNTSSSPSFLDEATEMFDFSDVKPTKLMAEMTLFKY